MLRGDGGIVIRFAIHGIRATTSLINVFGKLDFVISIIGAGKVGSAAAFNVLRYRISDVVLVDVLGDLARGEALDMMQAAPALEFDGKIVGTDDFSQIGGSEVVVAIAGVGRASPEMTRLDLMKTNSKTIKSVVRQIVQYAPDCKIMVVTNPVDVMTYVAYKESGFERNRVFGMGNILDIYRFRSYLAKELNVSREDIRALVMGEHGESMVPVLDYSSVSGIPIRSLLDEKSIERIVKSTRTAGDDIIRLKGSTTYAPGVVIAILIDAVLRGRNRVTCVSTTLRGEYGYSDVSIGVPVILGKNGVERILELALSPIIKKQFGDSVSIVKDMINQLKDPHHE